LALSRAHWGRPKNSPALFFSHLENFFERTHNGKKTIQRLTKNSFVFIVLVRVCYHKTSVAFLLLDILLKEPERFAEFPLFPPLIPFRFFGLISTISH
jgi:hypothetical protein